MQQSERAWYVSYSWMTLPIHVLWSCSPASEVFFSIAACTSGNVAFGGSRPGKRSPMSERNSGTSSATYLDRFMSRSVRISSSDSDASGVLRLVEPAVRSTERILRKPKS